MPAHRRGHGEGSIYQRGDGRWAAAISLGNGHRKALYGRTRQEVASKLARALRTQQDGLPLSSERLTVAAFAGEWLESIRASVRYKTWQQYEGLVRVHVLPNLGRVSLAKLQPSHLQRLYAGRLEAGASPKTVRNIHGTVHAMLAKAVRWGVVAQNAASLADPPRVPRRDLQMLTQQQVRAFLDAARGHRFEALFVLALTTGARSGELRGLTWNTVDLARGEMRIHSSLQETPDGLRLVEPKTTRSRRTVALGATAVEALRRHRSGQTEEALRLGPAWTNNLNLVFTNTVGQPLDRTNLLRREFRPLLRLAGLPARLRFHDLRHVAASFALSRGLPVTLVSEMLGHSQTSTTLDVYGHAIPATQRQVADALDAVVAG